MLEQNPDTGLRFALPILDHKSHRGQTPPMVQLGEQKVDFSIHSLASGGPVDIWDIHFSAKQRLIELYRQLANREIHLGRYRRAAFILGNLLGDLCGAVSVLKAGGYWRESAQICRDLLNAPLLAANCLTEGGLWSEAAPLYEELGMYEKAGDLYAKSEQQELAQKAYRRAVEQCLTHSDFLSAARIHWEKLHLPREAITILDQGWSSSSQARQCLEEIFRLLGQLGEHALVSKRIAELFDRYQSDAQGVVTVAVLAQVACSYPDHTIRTSAKDAVRVL
ncbi:MAG: hypothetical protein JW829_13245 [Pirellulales bacterium]|nr:hypothetical protein [Pirellulales bacterium]